MRRARRGFTLVELLVVIGIVALLVGILLPSLAAARRSSLVVVCQSNQRQLAAGTHLYANDNEGRLPVYLPHLPGTQGKRLSSPIKAYRVAYADATAGETAADVRPANHGVLFDDGYLGEAGVFYCPEQTAELWREGAYPRPWLSRGTTGVTSDGDAAGSVYLVRSSYLYQPILPSFSSPPFQAELRKYERLSDMRPDDAPPVSPSEPLLRRLPLFMDLLIGSRQPTVAHDENTSWNVALPDGSVFKFVDADTAVAHKQFDALNWPTFGIFLGRILNGD